MKEIIEKLLQEVDEDIRVLMLKESEQGKYPSSFYKNYELLADPANTILLWQAMRDRHA